MLLNYDWSELMLVYEYGKCEGSELGVCREASRDAAEWSAVFRGRSGARERIVESEKRVCDGLYAIGNFGRFHGGSSGLLSSR